MTQPPNWIANSLAQAMCIGARQAPKDFNEALGEVHEETKREAWLKAILMHNDAIEELSIAVNYGLPARRYAELASEAAAVLLEGIKKIEGEKDNG